MRRHSPDIRADPGRLHTHYQVEGMWIDLLERVGATSALACPRPANDHNHSRTSNKQWSSIDTGSGLALCSFRHQAGVRHSSHACAKAIMGIPVSAQQCT